MASWHMCTILLISCLFLSAYGLPEVPKAPAEDKQDEPALDYMADSESYLAPRDEELQGMVEDAQPGPAADQLEEDSNEDETDAVELADDSDEENQPSAQGFKYYRYCRRRAQCIHYRRRRCYRYTYFWACARHVKCRRTRCRYRICRRKWWRRKCHYVTRSCVRCR